MALSRFHLRLALILIMPLPVLLSAASHHHEQPASSAAHRPRHRYRTASATTHFHPAPSMHQNHHLEVEGSKSLLGVEPFAAMGQASSAEEAVAAMAAAAAADHPTLLAPPPQADQPSPPVDPFASAPDLASQAPPQPQAEEAAAPPPPLDEPTAAVMTFPLPDERTTAASPPPPVRAGAAGEVASGDDQRVVQLARVLTSLGYSEMASAAPLLVGSPDLARWTGAITIFAAPDISFRLLCPTCSRRRHLLEHIGLGYFSYSELAAVPAAKIPSASRGFCLSVASERGPYATHYARLFVDGVEVSYPELYNDGLYVVHGLHRALRPLSRASCSDGSHHHHHHHLTTRSAATSASVVRIMILEAISRLRDGGYGFVALAMRVKFAELEKFANLTVFALDDPAIFAGGGQDYVSAVRFHVVPGHRLTLADLLRLPAGTMLPTMAGEGQNLVITHGADSRSDDVIINYIPIKQPDVVVNSRIAVHGVYVPFPRLYLANLAASVAVASAIDMNGTCGTGGPFGGCASTATTSATTPGAHGYGEGQ